MINWLTVKEAATDDWNPVGGFDIIGGIPEHSPIDHEKAFGRAMKYGLTAGGLTWLIHLLLTRKKEDKIAQAKKRLKWALGIGGAAALAGYGHSVAEDAIRGTRFNYEGYHPTERGDYNIVVAGAGSGAHEHWYRDKYDTMKKGLGGHGKYVMFNPYDKDAQRRFIRELPEGSRVRIWGHSKGVQPAWELADFASRRGIEVNQLNTVDGVGKPFKSFLPKNVKKWNNFTLADRPMMNPSKWQGIKDFIRTGGIDGDLVATMGGILGHLDGAEDIEINNPKYMSHGESIFGVLNNEYK